MSLIYVCYTKYTKWEIGNFLALTIGGTELSTELDLLCYCIIAVIP